MARLHKKSLPLIGVVILLAVIVFFLVKTNTGESEKKMIPEVTVPKADISSENFKVTETDPDKGTKLTLEADEGSYSLEDEGAGRFKGFRLKYQTKDAFDFEFEGMNGEIDRAKNEINLSGGLKGKTGGGYLIFTERITILLNENCIKSDEAVTVEGPIFRITGKGLFMDLEKKTLMILKDVNSIFDTGAANL